MSIRKDLAWTNRLDATRDSEREVRASDRGRDALIKVEPGEVGVGHKERKSAARNRDCSPLFAVGATTPPMCKRPAAANGEKCLVA